jgi:hypothetical protein
LYEQAPEPYRLRLEQLHSYFHDWGIPVRRTATGLRIFGMLSSFDEPALSRCFNEVADLPNLEIDMSNFEGTGTLLYPVFKQLFQRSPNSKWRVNAGAQQQMKQAGIPETAMVLARTKLG